MSRDPDFVFGSMLPDLISMLRVRMPQLSLGMLQRGVEFHRETDRVFHASRWFGELQRESFQTLLERGLRRGGARAAAHVGIELLIDGVLAESLAGSAPAAPLGRAASESYLAALERGAAALTSATFQQDQDAHRLRALCQRLHGAGVQHLGAGPDLAMQQLERALRGRPRLQLAPDEALELGRWARQLAPVIEARLPCLLGELQNSLGLRLQ